MKDKYLQQTNNNSGRKLLMKLNNQKMIDYYNQKGDQNLDISQLVNATSVNLDLSQSKKAKQRGGGILSKNHLKITA